MIGNAFEALKTFVEFGSIVRDLDDEGITVEINYKGKTIVAAGRKAHSSLLSYIYGPIKIRNPREAFEVIEKVLSGVREDLSRE